MSPDPRLLACRQRDGRRELAPQLGGTGRLADDLYLMAHNDVTGKPRLQPRAVGIGLAGALLAELALLGKIWVQPDRTTVADPTRPEDDLAGLVLGLLCSEQHAARDWLLFLARTAARDVARRLANSGYLSRVSARRPWRGERWVPVDSDCAFTPLVRVIPALVPSRRVSVHGACLAGLANACGLGPRMFSYAPPHATRECLDQAVRQLSPGLCQLIAQTQAAVESAVLAQRA